MSFQLGLKALKALVQAEDAYAFHRAKLSLKLFKGEAEKVVFAFINDHVKNFNSLPQLATLQQAFPEIAEVECPEAAKYYLQHVENRFIYDRLEKGIKDTHELLKSDQQHPGTAKELLTKAINEITEQQFRHRIMNFNVEGKQMVMHAYHKMGTSEAPSAAFGWPYMDDLSGGAQPGDVISIVGRPAMGKSQFWLYVAVHNWKVRQQNVLFVSMEMNCVAVAQRLAAMYAETNLTQLSKGAFSSTTLDKFTQNIHSLKDEQGQFYVVDGNLAACVEDIYTLAAQLGCNLVVIDGAYLLRHKDRRLGRYEKIAENAELIKRMTGDGEIPTFCSWQFSKEAAKSKLKGTKAGLEHIGGSEAIGQISSVVLSLPQEDGVETLNTRKIELIKGRNGEYGEFEVNWDWNKMNFTQVGVDNPEDEPEDKTKGWV